MTETVLLSHDRTFPVEVERAFDEVLPLDLVVLFDRRHLAIPQVRQVRDQTGTWGTPGQTRTIALADGGTMRETLDEVVRPERFGYRIGDVTGPMRPLISALDGEWRFEPAGTGVRITWAWTVHPAGRLGTAAMPVFGRMWQGYARQAFDNLERLLVR